MLQVWALHHLQIIGEAVRGLSEEFLQQWPDPVWRQAVGLRNILVQHYFEIDSKRIWRVIQTDLEPLRKKVEQIFSTGL